MWWNNYVGTQYEDGGRDHTSLDCWGLVVLIYEEQLNITVPSFLSGYDIKSKSEISDMIRVHKESWSRISEPEPFSVVVFRIGGKLCHVGVMIDEHQFIHALEGVGVAIESVRSALWKNRVEGYYKYSEKTNDLTIPISAMPHPLKSMRVDGAVPLGMNLQEIDDWLRERTDISISTKTAIMVDGVPVPYENWATTIPDIGSRVDYRTLPGKGAVRNVLSIAVLIGASILAPYLAPYLAAGLGVSVGIATTIATAALTFAGTMLVNSIFPVRIPKQEDSEAPIRQKNMLNGGSNQASLFGGIPVVLGKIRYTPPLGARMIVESENEVSVLKMILCWSMGTVTLSDMRIGDLPINSLPGVTVATIQSTDPNREYFDSIYGEDVGQSVLNTELFCTQRLTYGASSRTGSIVTIEVTTDHNYQVGWWLNTYWAGATFPYDALWEIVEVVSPRVFRVSDPGGTLTTIYDSYPVTAGPWIDTIVPNICTRINLSFFLPTGLRFVQSATEYAEPLKLAIQYRPIDPITDLPLGAGTWLNTGSNVPETFITIEPAYYNTNLDDAIEISNRWCVVSVNTSNQIVVRYGDYVNAFEDEVATGQLLINQQRANHTSNYIFKRFPDIPDDEIVLWHIGVQGRGFYTYDKRSLSPVTLTGFDLIYQSTLPGDLVKYKVSAGTIARGFVTISVGANGEKYAVRRDPFSLDYAFTVPRGKYQVRAKRVTRDYLAEFATYQSSMSRIDFVSVTGYDNVRPITFPKQLTLSAIQIQASDLVNGTVEGISAVCTTVCPDWDTTTSTWIVRSTNNPASLLRYVLQHPANAQAASDAQIDLVGLQSWHDYCRNNAFYYNNVILDPTSLLELMKDICAAGRASPTMVDGKHTVIVDRPRSTIAQMFTPHNSSGFKSVKTLPKLPHAFRVAFYNEEKSYRADERIVYADGYSSSNATLFESISLPGITNGATIFKHARFHLAQMILRPERYSLTVDIEHLVCTRGDLVVVAHDIPMWGIGWAYIKERLSSTQIVIDEPVTLLASETYKVSIRRMDGQIFEATLPAVPADGEYTTITFTSISALQGEAGNLIFFGKSSIERKNCIVTSIEPMNNHTAKLTLEDYSPEVYNSDLGTIPDFDSNITLPHILAQPRLTKTPIFRTMVSDESAMYKIAPNLFGYRLIVSFRNPTGLQTEAKFVAAQITEASSLNWSGSEIVKLNTASSVIFNDVSEGEQYKVRLRYETEDGRVGPWIVSTSHTIVGKTTPPSTPTGLSVTTNGTAVYLNWNDNPEIDVVGYEVRTANSGWGTAGFLFKGAASQCQITPDNAGTITWYVKARDAAGLYSTNAAVLNFNPTKPGTVPNTVTQTIQKYFATTLQVEIAWESSTPGSFNIAGYEIRNADSGWGTAGFRFKGNANSAILTNISATAATTLYIRAFDLNGNYSALTRTFTIAANPNPATPTGLTASVSLSQDNRISLDWANNPEADVNMYEVRIADSGWGTAGYVYRGASSACLVIPAAAGVARTWYVKARDVTGKYSTTAASVSFTVTAPSTISAPIQTIQRVLGNTVNLQLDWAQPTLGSFDIAGYEIRSANSGWGTAGFLYRGLTNSALLANVSALAQTTFYLRAYDILKNYSPTTTIVHDVVPPLSITGATMTVTRVAADLFIDLTSLPSMPNDFDCIEMRIGKVGAGATSGNDATDIILAGPSDNFWSDPDCQIVRVFDVTPFNSARGSISLSKFIVPRIAASPGMVYRVAARVRDKSGNYSTASLLGTISVTTIV